MSALAVSHQVDGPPDAPVLVLSNSLGSAMRMWEPQVPALSERFRVVRYDHRGHGASPVPQGPYSIAELGEDVLALLDRLGVARASFCGLSLGGMVGMWLAAHVPERIEHLVLCCTSASLGPASRWRDRADTVRASGTSAVADEVVANWFTPAFAQRCGDVVERSKEMILATPAEGYAGCCEAIERMDLTSDLAAVRAPTLIVAGAQDPATPPAHAHTIAAAIARAEVAEVAEAAHMANIEQADIVTELIVGHLSDDVEVAQ